MADVDFGLPLRVAFNTGTKFIEFPGGIKVFKQLAQRLANKVLGQFGAVFGPVGFYYTHLGLLDLHVKAVGLPKLVHFGPHVVQWFAGYQPTALAFALQLHRAHRIRYHAFVLLRLLVVARRRGRLARHLVAALVA